MNYDPGVKMLMQYKKNVLIAKARSYKLFDEGTKMDLAKRISEHENNLFTKTWEGISSDGSKKER